jgi:hypothetical protein
MKIYNLKMKYNNRKNSWKNSFFKIILILDNKLDNCLTKYQLNRKFIFFIVLRKLMKESD